MNIDYGNLFKIHQPKEIKKFSFLDEDEQEEGVEWVVTYHLPALGPEYDDDFEDFREEVVITALDATDAAKYAEQYIKVQRRDNDSWKDAEILSIQRR